MASRESKVRNGRRSEGRIVRYVRYTPAAALQGPGEHRAGWWYVLDLLTTEAAESDAKKGWFRSKKTAQKAADRMNRKPDELGRNYVRLTNGYIAVAQGWSREAGFHIGEKHAEAMRLLEEEYDQKLNGTAIQRAAIDT